MQNGDFSIIPFTFISWHSTKEQLFLLPCYLFIYYSYLYGLLDFYFIWQSDTNIIYFDAQIVLIWPVGTSPLQAGSLCPFDKSSSFSNFSSTVQFPFNNFALFNNSLFSFLQKFSPLCIPLLVINEKWHTKKGIF